MDNKQARKLISVFTPCYNEEDNINDVYTAVKNVRNQNPQYDWEHIFIDNASEDRSLYILKQLAEKDKNLKIIANIKNFGIIRSPYYGILQAQGDAVVNFLCDLQEPAELINDFLRKWEEGHKIVIAVKQKSEENRFTFLIRRMYYAILEKISESGHIKNFSGFGLYDKSFMDIIRRLEEPYPYFRGLVMEYGENIAKIPYTQRRRKKEKSKSSFYSMYDNAMLGFVNHSKVPLRLATFLGFSVSILSILVAIVYFVYKLIFWERFQVGIAPMVIGFFFFAAIQLFFIGIIGEYIGAIYTQVKGRPLVVEKERINFDTHDSDGQ